MACGCKSASGWDEFPLVAEGAITGVRFQVLMEYIANVRDESTVKCPAPLAVSLNNDVSGDLCMYCAILEITLGYRYMHKIGVD